MDPSTLNLLPREEVSIGEKTLKWALTSGRIIVVITEFIVISAFLYRFILDRTLTDLDENINDNIIVLEESRDTERSIRVVQTQLTEADRILRQHQPFRQLINTLAYERPPELIFDEVTYGGERITVSATTNRTAAAVEFFQNLNDNSAFVNVRINEAGVVSGKLKLKLSAQVQWENITNEDV